MEKEHVAGQKLAIGAHRPGRLQAIDRSHVLDVGGRADAGGSEAKSEVMFASLTVGGETKRYYRFQTPDDSVVDYYDESG